MSITITDLTPGFVGEVSGVDITQPLTRLQVAALEAGMDRYAVLVYHDQRLSDDQQQAFSRNFGPLESTAGGNVTRPEDRRLDPGMADVSNLGADHKPLIVAGCSTWAIGCGTPTVRSVPSRPNIRCCRDASWWTTVGAPNSPTCVPPMTHWMTQRRPRSKT